MRTLGDVPCHRLAVECDPCRRRGCYQLAGLVARHGPGYALRDFLDLMRTRCARQPCHAHLIVPMRIDLDRQTHPGNTFSLDIWESETTHEMTLGAVCVFDVATAAFEKAVTLWPHSTITVRLKSQIMRAHRPEEIRAREAQVRLLKSLRLR